MSIKLFDAARLVLQNMVLTRNNQQYLTQITLLKEENKRLNERIALYKIQIELDQLTSVYNRTTFESQVKRSIANDEFGILAIVDVDDFKRINDIYGHSKGDMALTKLTEKLKNRFRQTDLIGRFGGDEFLIFLRNINIHTAIPLLEGLSDEMAEIQIEDAEKETLSISMGVVEYNPSLTYDKNFEIADMALYESKKSGKGQIHIGDTKSHKTTK